MLFQQVDLRIVDEDPNFARVGEVEHRREIGGADDPIVLLGRHVGQGHAHQRSADAPADGVDLLLPRRLLYRIERGNRPLDQVFVEGLVGIALVRIDP